MKSFWRHCFVFLSQNLFKFTQTAGAQGLRRSLQADNGNKIEIRAVRELLIGIQLITHIFMWVILYHSSDIFLSFFFPRSAKTRADVQKEFWEKAQKSNMIFTSSYISYQWYLAALSEWLHAKNRNIASSVASTVYRCVENHRTQFWRQFYINTFVIHPCSPGPSHLALQSLIIMSCML